MLIHVRSPVNWKKRASLLILIRVLLTKYSIRYLLQELTINREVEFVKYMNFAFYRIALTGIAAIVILLISIFLMQGSLSFNSLLGLNDNYNESIVCLLTGN